MSEIKILKDGLVDYETCVTTIENKFTLLDTMEANIRAELAEKSWQGVSHDKCETILTLTTEYKNKIKELLDEMNQKELELKQNATDFPWQSSVITSL